MARGRHSADTVVAALLPSPLAGEGGLRVNEGRMRGIPQEDFASQGPSSDLLRRPSSPAGGEERDAAPLDKQIIFLL
jgi:hypothetical protein